MSEQCPPPSHRRPGDLRAVAHLCAIGIHVGRRGTKTIDEAYVFSRDIKTDIVIRAPASVIWAVLTNLGAYASWNPFIREAEGRIRPGEQLRLSMSPADGKAFRIAPRVHSVDEARELRWRGRILLPYLFDAEHRFVLTPRSERETHFEQSETFFGVLVPFTASLLADTEKKFHAMNVALKERCEGAPLFLR